MSAWYRAGTVTVTNGSVNVVGVDTLWLSQAAVGDAFSIDGDKLYEIASITDNMHLALQAPYTGTTAGGASYGIIRNFTGTTQAELAAQLATLLNSWQTREDQYRSWQAGTLTGGTYGDGRYPISDILGNTYYYNCPAKLDRQSAGLFGHNAAVTTGLTLGYFGGVMLVDGTPTTIADGTVALTASTTNYVEATRAGVVSKNTTGFTAGSIPIREVVTGAAAITTITERLPRDVPVVGRLSKSVAGNTDVTLTAIEARNQVMEFTGALTGSISVNVPAVAAVLVVGNGTSGAYTLTVKTEAGTGVAVTQGKKALLICDGTNVVNALSHLDSPTMTGTTQVAALTASGLATLNGGVLQNATAQILGGWSGTTPIRTSVGIARTDAWFADSAAGPVHQNLKGRGTEASPTVTSSGDILGAYSFVGYNTANAKGDAAAITCTQDGAATASGVPGKLNFYASDGTTDAIRVAVSATALTCVSATTASAANVYQSASGAALLRSTSSIRYKQNIEPLQSAFAQKALDLKPVWYRSKADADRKEWSYYGLIAEEVAAVEPRLVHWVHRDTKEVLTDNAVPAMEAVFDESGVEVSPATPEKPAKYMTVPDETSPLIPDGVQYERLSVLLLKVVQEQQSQIAALEARIAVAGW